MNIYYTLYDSGLKVSDIMRNYVIFHLHKGSLCYNTFIYKLKNSALPLEEHLTFRAKSRKRNVINKYFKIILMYNTIKITLGGEALDNRM